MLVAADDHLDAYDFALPPELIALRPARPRHHARLLTITPGTPELHDGIIGDLSDQLKPDDVLVVNDTRVSAVQLEIIRTRPSGEKARISLTLIESLGTDGKIVQPQGGTTAQLKGGTTAQLKGGTTAQLKGGTTAQPQGGTTAQPQGGTTAQIEGGRIVQPEGWHCWRALARPARRLSIGDLLCVAAAPEIIGTVVAIEGAGAVLVSWPADLISALAQGRIGTPPLPPYIASRRGADLADRDDYQTLFARRDGAAAAPTAGLHFTPTLMKALRKHGLAPPIRITLHIGRATFEPIRTPNLSQHHLHAEWGEITPAAAALLNQAHRQGRRRIAVGTTALRLLESAANEDGTINPFRGETDLFIYPGYRFRAVDGLLTNFHLPRSSLLVLVAAFIGRERLLQAYRHAIATGYRFYSYGDSCLIWRGAMI